MKWTSSTVCQSKRIGWNDITTIRINKSKVILGKHIKTSIYGKIIGAETNWLNTKKSTTVTTTTSMFLNGSSSSSSNRDWADGTSKSKCLATIRNCISAWHFPLNLIRFFRWWFIFLCVSLLLRCNKVACNFRACIFFFVAHAFTFAFFALFYRIIIICCCWFYRVVFPFVCAIYCAQCVQRIKTIKSIDFYDLNNGEWLWNAHKPSDDSSGKHQVRKLKNLVELLLFSLCYDGEREKGRKKYENNEIDIEWHLVILFFFYLTFIFHSIEWNIHSVGISLYTRYISIVFFSFLFLCNAKHFWSIYWSEFSTKESKIILHSRQDFSFAFP